MWKKALIMQKTHSIMQKFLTKNYNWFLGLPVHFYNFGMLSIMHVMFHKKIIQPLIISLTG